VATGTDYPQKKATLKRGDFRAEVNAARSARGATVSGSHQPARDSSRSLKRTVSDRISPQTLYVSFLTPAYVWLCQLKITSLLFLSPSPSVAPDPKRLKRSYGFTGEDGLVKAWRASLTKSKSSELCSKLKWHR
jgi:hypothetical protein